MFRSVGAPNKSFQRMPPLRLIIISIHVPRIHHLNEVRFVKEFFIARIDYVTNNKSFHPREDINY